MHEEPLEPPHPVDQHVGSRIRLRRDEVRFSQGQVVARLGLTIAQIQAYECGDNRVGAFALRELGELFGVPVSYFFEGLEGVESPIAQQVDSYRQAVEAMLGAANEPDVEGALLSLRYHRKAKQPAPALGHDDHTLDVFARFGLCPLPGIDEIVQSDFAFGEDEIYE